MDRNGIEAKLHQLIHLPFDLHRGPLLHVYLLHRGVDEHTLLFVIHHIIADAWSLDILYRELVSAYTAALTGTTPQLPPLSIQCADYAEWQRDWLAGNELRKQLDYWQTQLANAPALLELPLDRPRPRVQTHNRPMETVLPAILAEKLKQLALQSGAHTSILYLAAFNVLLAVMRPQMMW